MKLSDLYLLARLRGIKNIKTKTKEELLKYINNNYKNKEQIDTILYNSDIYITILKTKKNGLITLFENDDIDITSMKKSQIINTIIDHNLISMMEQDNNEIIEEYLSDVINRIDFQKLCRTLDIKGYTNTTKQKMIPIVINKMNEKNYTIGNINKLINQKKQMTLTTYLNKNVNRNNLRILCKNLEITNYSRPKRELIPEVVKKLEKNNMTKDDIVKIITGDTVICEEIEITMEEEVEKVEAKHDDIKDMGFTDDIKYIYHLSDLHIRRNERIEEYKHVFDNFISQLKMEYSQTKNKALIVICGDIFHFKTSQRAEGLNLFTHFIKELTTLHPVILLMGNHDVDLSSTNMDIITPFMNVFDKNLYYLRYSGMYMFNNIVIVANSLLDNKILNITNKLPGKKYISLYHGTINGSKVFNGTTVDSIYTLEHFGDFDYLMMGDIHKHQYLKDNICYSGSMIQQNRGESLYVHGYVFWDIEEDISEHREVQNDWGTLKLYLKGNGCYHEGEIFEASKIKNKKYLNVCYNIFYEKDYINIIEAIEECLKSNNIQIINSQVIKEFNNMEEYLNTSSLIKHANTSTLIEEKLKKDGRSDVHINNIIAIHKKVIKDMNIRDENYKTSWVLHDVKFKNIFSYGGNIENHIKFDKNGFYKIFGDNFLGKTSVINLIKWGLYGSASYVNDKDILYRGKNSSDIENGFIHITFQIQDRIYKLYKNIKRGKITRSQTSSGIKVETILETYNGEKKIDELRGKDVALFLSNIIGTYEDFELVSSINNSDLGILKSKQCLGVFEKLFKIEKYKEMEKTIKEKIKEITIEIKRLKIESRKYHGENYEESIKNINSIIDEMRKEISAIKMHPDDDIKNIKDEIRQLEKEISELRIIKLHPCESFVPKIKAVMKKLELDSYEHLEKRIEELEIENEDIKLYPCDKEYKNQEEKITKIGDKLKKYRSDPGEIKYLEDEKDKLLKSFMKFKEGKEIKKEEVLKKQILVKELKDEKNTLIARLHPIECDENLLLEKIKNQPFSYTNEKDRIVDMLKAKKLKLKRTDINNIIFLLENDNFEQLLEKTRKNSTMNDRIREIDTQLVIEEKAFNILVNQFEKYTKMEEAMNFNKGLETKLEEIQIQLKEANERENNNRKYNNLLERCGDLQEHYNEYIRQIEHNKKFKERKIDILKRLRLFKNLKKYIEDHRKYETYEQDKEHNRTSNERKTKLTKILITKRNTLEDMINHNNTRHISFNKLKTSIDYKNIELGEKNEAYEEKKAMLKEMTEKQNIKESYDEYKKLVGEKGLPCTILEDKIPFIEQEINKHLEVYTNFKIKINIEGNGTRKKIIIYQYKDGTDKLLSVNSCSGYESFILNVIFKTVIKKSCYINFPSIIAIDEVWEKISETNYDKLDSIFELLVNNYKNILVISHIESIKNKLMTYDGDYIKIKRCEEGYSKLI